MFQGNESGVIPSICGILNSESRHRTAKLWRYCECCIEARSIASVLWRWLSVSCDSRILDWQSISALEIHLSIGDPSSHSQVITQSNVHLTQSSLLKWRVDGLGNKNPCRPCQPRQPCEVHTLFVLAQFPLHVFLTISETLNLQDGKGVGGWPNFDSTYIHTMLHTNYYWRQAKEQ